MDDRRSLMREIRREYPTIDFYDELDLTENMKEIARFHKLSLSEAEQLLEENFWRFTGMSAQ